MNSNTRSSDGELPDFPDHFSAISSAYSSFRPTWPPALFKALADAAPSLRHAVDTGCGSGQASVALAELFERVTACDASENQIAAARKASLPANLTYRVAPAEKTGLEDSCADLVLAAQAAHWYRLEEFFSEARRLLRSGGLLALCSYNLFSLPDDDASQIIADFHDITLEPWWPPQRAMVIDEYRSVKRQMPFEALPAPQIDMTVDWTLEQLCGYFSSWSAIERRRRDKGDNPIPEVAEQLRSYWPQQGKGVWRLCFPLTLVLGRHVD